MLDQALTTIMHFLKADFRYAEELQALGVSIQGAMLIRTTLNKDRKMPLFRAFKYSLMGGYAGVCFGFLWFGTAGSILSNDVHVATAMLAFLFVNYTPRDLGFKLCNTLPVTFITVLLSQLFRSIGLCQYVMTAFRIYTRHPPSGYYPIPVFGPILYGALSGNMFGLFSKGLEGYLAKGDVPLSFQNGLVCGTFFHFFVNDQEGPIGFYLRRLVTPLRNELDNLDDNELDRMDDHELGVIIVGLVMLIIGILQSPLCYGPNFDPFAYFFMGGEAQEAVDKIPPLIEEKKLRAGKNDVAVVHENCSHRKTVMSKDGDVNVVHENGHHHKRVMSKDEENPKDKYS